MSQTASFLNLHIPLLVEHTPLFITYHWGMIILSFIPAGIAEIKIHEEEL